jgi:hypothetical protein
MSPKPANEEQATHPHLFSASALPNHFPSAASSSNIRSARIVLSSSNPA